MAPMYGNGGGGRAAKPVKATKKISLKQRDKELAAAKGLAKLDVVSKPLKASARKQMIKNQIKGK